MPIDIFEALKWVDLGLARIGLFTSFMIVVLFFISRVADTIEADRTHLSLCRKQAVTPQDFAECK